MEDLTNRFKLPKILAALRPASKIERENYGLSDFALLGEFDGKMFYFDLEDNGAGPGSPILGEVGGEVRYLYLEI